MPSLALARKTVQNHISKHHEKALRLQSGQAIIRARAAGLK
jgi:hypothetical protein